jgi:hypothetical protein
MKKMIILAAVCAAMVVDAQAMFALRRMGHQSPCRARAASSLQLGIWETNLHSKERQLVDIEAYKNNCAWRIVHYANDNRDLQNEVDRLQSSSWLAFVRMCSSSLAKEHKRNEADAKNAIEHNKKKFLEQQENLIDLGIKEKEIKCEVNELRKKIEEEKQQSSLKE